MLPFFGSLLSGIASSGISGIANSALADKQVANQNSLNAFNSRLSINQLANSGSAQRQAKRSQGLSTAFVDGGNTPLPSFGGQASQAQGIDMSSIGNIFAAIKNSEAAKENAEAAKQNAGTNASLAPSEISSNEASANQSNAAANYYSTLSEKNSKDTELVQKQIDWYDDLSNRQIKLYDKQVEDIDNNIWLSRQKLPYELDHYKAMIGALVAQKSLSYAQSRVATQSLANLSQELNNLEQQYNNLTEEQKQIAAETRLTNKNAYNAAEQGKLLHFQNDVNQKLGSGYIATMSKINMAIGQLSEIVGIGGNLISARGSYMNANTNRMNANTNRMNAKTNANNANTNAATAAGRIGLMDAKEMRIRRRR